MQITLEEWIAKQPALFKQRAEARARMSQKQNTIERHIHILRIEGDDAVSKKGKPYVVLDCIYQQDGELKSKTCPVFTNEGKLLLTLNENKSYTITIQKIDGRWTWTKALGL